MKFLGKEIKVGDQVKIISCDTNFNGRWLNVHFVYKNDNIAVETEAGVLRVPNLAIIALKKAGADNYDYHNPDNEDAPQLPNYEAHTHLSERPEREQIIQKDEITDLIILLNTTKSVDEFLTLI